MDHHRKSVQLTKTSANYTYSNALTVEVSASKYYNTHGLESITVRHKNDD